MQSWPRRLLKVTAVRLLLLTLALCLIAADSSGVTLIQIQGSPFMALPSADGSLLFASVETPGRKPNEIEEFKRDGAAFTLVQSWQIDGQPLGLALTPDGSALLIADGDAYGIMALPPGAAPRKNDITLLHAGANAGVIEAAVTRDGDYAFFSSERREAVDLVRITHAENQKPGLVFLRSISVDRDPVGLALSPDGRYLYVTSEAGNGAPDCGANAAGTLSVIDVASAEQGSARVAAATGAGCEPVRVAVSPDGKVVWVTVRAENQLTAFDAAKLLSHQRDALIGTMTVGDNPVGLAVAGLGKFVLVANSRRFDQDSTASTVTIVDPQGFVSGGNVITRTIRAGSFPREITESKQNDMIYVTNYNSDTIEAIPESLLAVTN